MSNRDANHRNDARKSTGDLPAFLMSSRDETRNSMKNLPAFLMSSRDETSGKDMPPFLMSKRGKNMPPSLMRLGDGPSKKDTTHFSSVYDELPPWFNRQDELKDDKKKDGESLKE